MKTPAILLSLALIFIAAASAEVHDLTSKDGRKIRAEIIPKTRNAIEIVREDNGKSFILTLDELSPESRKLADSIIDETLPKGFHAYSIRVKKVEGKYRYFFLLKNHGPGVWEGKVKITLHNKVEGLTNGSDVFTSKAPIADGGGTTVFIDSRTAPDAAQVHGDAHVAWYSYDVNDVPAKKKYPVTKDFSATP